MYLQLGIPEFETIVENILKNIGINPTQASDQQRESILKHIDDKIRLVWAALVENQYLDTQNLVPQMINAF